MLILAHRLKKLRESRQLTSQKVADGTNKTKSAYLKYEQNLSEPSQEILVRLVKFYNTSANYLLGLTDDEGPLV